MSYNSWRRIGAVRKIIEGPLSALKITPFVTSAMVLLLVLGEFFNLITSGVLSKILEYIQALGR
jgi:hypothetical protein